MCNLCQTKPVYEFTNKRKLCKRCFIKWFQKKVFYTIRKFGMLKKGDVVGYFEGNDFRSVVLKEVLNLVKEKGFVGVMEFPAYLRSQIDDSQSALPDCSLKKNLLKGNFQLINKSAKNRVGHRFEVNINPEKKPRQIKINKIAISTTIDITVNKIISEIIRGDVKKLEDVEPVDGKIIKLLHLFLDEEVLLYAKLKKLGAKAQIDGSKLTSSSFSLERSVKSKSFLINNDCTNKVMRFINKLEIKHPEVKRAVVKGWLELVPPSRL